MGTITEFLDSTEIYNCSSICSFSSDSSAQDFSALRLLSHNLESIFGSSDFDYLTDATIVTSNGKEVPVNRCILAARSHFFKNVFSGSKKSDGRPVVKFELKELGYEIGFDSLVAVLGYLYSGKVKSLPKGVCVCVDEDCLHLACRPALDSMVEVLYASFTFQIAELVTLYQKRLLDILEKVAAEDILAVLSVANVCGNSCESLRARCIEIIVRSDVDSVTLDKALPHHVVKQIIDSRAELGVHKPEIGSVPDKHVKRIQRALDSDDVELVRMLLKEAHTTLDDACALHYAVAYCDAKTTTELLDLGLADVNCRNSRGYSVLHIAAMRKEPKIIVSLLTKGARPSDLTTDGRKALQIAKRLTKAVDYFTSTEEGNISPKDRLCVEILEQAERRDPLLGEASFSLAMAGDDLRMKLLYLEHRVGLAKLLFPMEAKVVMDIAQVDGTSELPLAGVKSINLGGAQRTTVDLNDAPFKLKEEHLTRLRALSKTVELGKRFFPRCSEVLNKIMDADDISRLACLEISTPEEQQMKDRRYMEFQDVLTQAFNEDKEEIDRSTVSSSSSSTSLGMVRPNGNLDIHNK